MRQGHKIIFVTLTASMAMAFIGGSSAMAGSTQLCSTDPSSSCTAVTHVHESTLAGSKAILKSSILKVECDVLFLSTKVGALAAPQVIEGNFTYSNCNNSCIAEEENGPSELKVLKTATETAELTGEGLVHLECGSFIDCLYNGEGLVGTLKGALTSSETNGEVKLTEQNVKEEGGSFFCPDTSKLTITTTPLSAGYIGDSGDGELATSTSLSTSLKGGGKEGAEITVAEGSKVKDTATLSGTNVSSATGTVDYAVYKDKECKELVTEAGKVTVKEGKVPDSEEKELEAGKEYFWQAKYLGDEMNKESTSTCNKEVLKVKANTSLSTSLSGGGKEGAEITVAEGSKVKDTATLSGTNVSSATSTVDYSVYKDKECKELATEAGKGKVEGTKAASSEEKELEAGAVYYWQAKYLGDSLHEESTSTCSKEVLTVKAKVSLATKLSGGGKEGEEITVAEGSKVKDQATLSGTKSSTAKGTIKYAVYKDKECKELATKAGEGEVKEGKAPASEEKELEAGAVYYWQAEYGGDSLHEAATSTCNKEVETVKAKVSLSTKLSGGGKEGSKITVAEGSKVKDTATLSGTNVSSATGTVTYKVYKDKECKELATEAGKGKVEGTKAASSEEKELEAGAVYYWQAEYGGDSLHESSTSTCDKESVEVEKFEPHKTALCSTDEAGSICLEEHKPSTVDFNDSAVEFLTNLLNSKCEGLISGTVGAAGKPQEVKAEYKFSSCTNGCAITEISGGSKLAVLFETSEKIPDELATVTTEGLEIFFKCGETVKCAFGPIKVAGDQLGALRSGDNGHITFSKSSLGKGEGLLCPSEASFDALFSASSKIYIRENDSLTALCSKDEVTPICKSENQLKTIDYKDKAVEILTNLINVKCEGLVSGSVGAPGNPLEIKPELTYTGCSGGCFVTSIAGPGKILLEREGKVEEAKATAEGFEIFVKCGTTIKCLLGPEKMSGTALGALTTGDNGHLTWSKASLGKGEGATCPKEATLDALYVASSAAYIG